MKNFLKKILHKNSIKYPDKLAFIEKGSSITWKQLYKVVSIYSETLKNKFKSHEIIPIVANKSITTIKIVLAALFSGHPFVYINDELPETRRDLILESTNASSYIRIKNDLIYYERIKNSYQKYKNNLAYIIFTSGSTGEPKGIKITKKNIDIYVKNFIQTFKIDENEVLGNQSPFEFDMSIGDLFITIYTAATLCLIDRSMFILQKDLINFLIENKVTTIIWCVSALCSFHKYNSFSYKVPNLKKIMFIGESMPLNSLKYLMKHIPDAEYINLYGPTETTCASSFFKLNGDETSALPIGKPFDHEKLFLIDENQNQIKKPFIKGEICISGKCLADGYIKKDETKKSFKRKFFKKFYKTGDIGYFDENENFYFVNRKDDQIKFNGYRIELGEIENVVLKNIKSITRCKCIFERNTIYLFYTGEQQDESEIKRKLRKNLPYYMLPKFIYLENLKYTNNGKIDKKYLKEYIDEKHNN